MGRAFNFPQTAPLIVPDQKMTVGALNKVVMRWWKALECSLERRGGVYLQLL